MIIEIVHDQQGNITGAYVVDTSPCRSDIPLVTYSALPNGCVQARANIDTVTAMEIEAGSGPKAVINAQGQPEIVNVSRSEYVIANYLVDVNNEIIPPASAPIPAGWKMRGLIRK